MYRFQGITDKQFQTAHPATCRVSKTLISNWNLAFTSLMKLITDIMSLWSMWMIMSLVSYYSTTGVVRMFRIRFTSQIFALFAPSRNDGLVLYCHVDYFLYVEKQQINHLLQLARWLLDGVPSCHCNFAPDILLTTMLFFDGAHSKLPTLCALARTAP